MNDLLVNLNNYITIKVYYSDKYQNTIMIIIKMKNYIAGGVGRIFTFITCIFSKNLKRIL